jgi:hypothetical protein
LFIIALDPILNFGKGKTSATERSVFAHIFYPVFIFTMWALSLIFFRAPGFDAAINGFKNLGIDNVSGVVNFGLNGIELKLSFILLVILLLQEILWAQKGEIIQTRFYQSPKPLRWIFYIALVLTMVYLGQYGTGNEHSFIYFQF